jgi:integrase
MPVYPRQLAKGLRYFYKFDFQGTVHKSKTIYLTKSDAKKAEAKFFSQIAKRSSADNTIVYLLDMIDERLDLLQIQKSKGYYNESKRYYKQLLKRFDNKPLHEISKADINSFLMRISEKQQRAGKDNYVVNAMLRNYKALFNYAIDTYELDMKNPCRKLKFYPIDIKLKYIPPDEDIEAVKNLCDPKQKMLIEFLEETGARISEALRLTGKDIVCNSVILYTRKSKNSNLMPRKLPKPNCLTGYTFEQSERVFSEWTSDPKFLERKQVLLKQQPWGFHSLRHRRASLWSKEGKPLFEIMSLLGHSQLSTTQNYLQLLS